MSHTDPIADMLARMRNAVLARKKEVSIPLSKIKLDISKILKREGYISDFKVEKDFPPQIIVDLKYENKNQNVIEGSKRISKPGLRVYANVGEIPKVLGGLGLVILSTSKGLMTGTECLKNNIGGEVLLYVW